MKNLLLLKTYFVKSSIYLVILLVKTLFSRNFCQKSVRVNFCKFRSVHRGFWQKFRESNIQLYLKNLLNSWFHEIFFRLQRIFYSHWTVCRWQLSRLILFSSSNVSADEKYVHIIYRWTFNSKNKFKIIRQNVLLHLLQLQITT